MSVVKEIRCITRVCLCLGDASFSQEPTLRKDEQRLRTFSSSLTKTQVSNDLRRRGGRKKETTSKEKQRQNGGGRMHDYV